MEWCGAAHGYWLYLLYVQEVVFCNLLHKMGHYFLDRRYQTNIPLVLRFDGVIGHNALRHRLVSSPNLISEYASVK